MNDTAPTQPRRPSRWETYEPVHPSPAAGWAMDIVREPSPLFGPNGIRFAPDGRLWVTELVGDHITAWDVERDVLEIASPMGSPLSAPDDLAFDSAGDVYVTETLSGRVSGRRAGGEYFVLLDEVPAPNGITVDAADRLFVDEMREGGRLLEVDRHEPNSFRVVAEGLDWLNALDQGPDGRLYLPQVMAGTVLSVDRDSGEVRTALDGLANPTAVKFDGDGRIVVAEAGEGVVARFDLDGGGGRTVLATTSKAIDNFCFDRAGNLYVSNFIEARVERFAAGQDRVDRVLSSGGLMGPYHLAVWDDDSLLVADANSIARVGLDGSITRLTRLLIDQPFVAVGAVRVAGHLVALTLAGEVFRLDGAGPVKLVAATSEESDQYLSTAAAGATAISSEGVHLLVGLAEGAAVVTMDPQGEVRDRRATGLGTVSAVAGRGDLVAACDAGAGDLVVVPAGGAARRCGDLGAPEAVAVTDDAVFVAERATGRVVRLSHDLSRRDVVASGLPFGLPRDGLRLGRRASLLAMADGSLLVGCDGDGSIRRLRAT